MFQDASGIDERFDALQMDSESSVDGILFESLSNAVSSRSNQAMSEHNTSSVNTRESGRSVGGKLVQSKNGSGNGGNNSGSCKQPLMIDGSTVGAIVTQVVSALQPKLVSVIL